MALPESVLCGLPAIPGSAELSCQFWLCCHSGKREAPAPGWMAAVSPSHRIGGEGREPLPVAQSHLPLNHMGLVGALLLLIPPLAGRSEGVYPSCLLRENPLGKESPEGSVVHP